MEPLQKWFIHGKLHVCTTGQLVIQTALPLNILWKLKLALKINIFFGSCLKG